MENGMCELCGDCGPMGTHHLIPRCALKGVQVQPGFQNPTMRLCGACHDRVHRAFIEHLKDSRRIEGVNEFDGVKYQVLREFLRCKYPAVFKDWRRYVSRFMEEGLTEFTKEV